MLSVKTLIKVCLTAFLFHSPSGFGTQVLGESVCVEEMRKQTYANTRGVMPKRVSCFFLFFYDLLLRALANIHQIKEVNIMHSTAPITQHQPSPTQGPSYFT